MTNPAWGTRYSFEAIGTHWQVDLVDVLDVEAEQDLLRRILRRIEQFDLDYSRFRRDSLVTQMATVAGTYRLPADSAPLLELYERLYETTAGAVTPLIGQVLVDAGYDADYSLKPGIIRQPPAKATTYTYQPPDLVMHQPALLDFGAAGKGYLVDIVADLLRAAGFADFCVDAGGDMVYDTSTKQPLRVGLEDPANPDRAIGVLELASGSICASSGSRRAWDQYHHIMDPATLRPVRQIMAVWTTATTALIADGLATALFFTPGELLQRHFEFEYLILRPDYSVEQSEGFVAELFER